MDTRVSFLYAEHGYLEMDGHSVVLRQGEILTHFPIGNTCVVMIMPGTVITHAAVKACADEGALLIWAGDGGVRCYSAGNPGGSNAESLLRQAALRLNENSRLLVARKIFKLMFGEDAPMARSVDQLRGIEGGKVKELYKKIASEVGVKWEGRVFKGGNAVNQAISHANAALYGLTEAVILALGYSPAIGFVHSGDERSFVFDVADCVKFSLVTPIAMKIGKEGNEDIEGRTRRACRNLFQEKGITGILVSIVSEIFTDG